MVYFEVLPGKFVNSCIEFRLWLLTPIELLNTPILIRCLFNNHSLGFYFKLVNKMAYGLSSLGFKLGLGY